MALAFEVLAEPNRRRILDLLLDHERHVGELVDALAISQPAVSKHLRILRDAGLVDVRVEPVIHVLPPGNDRRTIFLDFIRNIRDAALEDGLVDETELDELMDELRRHVDDPGTLVLSHLFFQVWGRKPR